MEGSHSREKKGILCCREPGSGGNRMVKGQKEI